MENKERKIATRELEKNLKPLPDAKELISLNRKFTREEFEKISVGLIPLGMDEKWLAFLENNIL
jgi:hypothetical protein